MDDRRAPLCRRVFPSLFALLLPLTAACGTGTTGDTSASSEGAQGSQGSASGAGSSSGGDHQPLPPELFSPSIKQVVVEVDYAKGAAPYTGNLVLFGDTWGVFQANAARVFQGAGKTLDIPTELAAMEELSDVAGAEFTVQAILDIAAAHRDTPSSGDRASFYFVWLPGYYNDGMEVRKDVLGVSIGTTGIIAMFKPVIQSTGLGPGTNVEKYVEQATLVHEFGHAIGLVENGLPATTAHHDAPHGAHCSNTECVMYYAIEGTSGAVEFAQKYVSSQGSILFADDCLADIDAMIKKSGGM